MDYTSIRFTNVGPIEDGTIRKDKMSIFMGPNNSGKSIAAKIIHGICQSHSSQHGAPAPAGPAAQLDGDAKSALEFAADTVTMARHAGLRPDDVPTHGKDISSLAVHGADGLKEFDFAAAKGNSPAHHMSLARDRAMDDLKRSIYMPATRAGTAQYVMSILHLFTRMAQVQHNLLNQILGVVKSEDEKIGSGTIPVNPDQLLADPFSTDLARHVAMVIEVITSGLDKRAQDMFGRLFPGAILTEERLGVPSITYNDPSGHRAGIESVGSGIASLLPLVAGIYRIGQGGVYIIEEPESHLEPQRLLDLTDEILRIADETGISVVITTQSDFFVQKILSLVSSGRLSQSDLGVYYFRRTADSLTRIRRIHVEKTGEAEQEMFTKATDSLIAGFSE